MSLREDWPAALAGGLIAGAISIVASMAIRGTAEAELKQCRQARVQVGPTTIDIDPGVYDAKLGTGISFQNVVLGGRCHVSQHVENGKVVTNMNCNKDAGQ